MTGRQTGRHCQCTSWLWFWNLAKETDNWLQTKFVLEILLRPHEKEDLNKSMILMSSGFTGIPLFVRGTEIYSAVYKWHEKCLLHWPAQSLCNGKESKTYYH